MGSIPGAFWSRENWVWRDPYGLVSYVLRIIQITSCKRSLQVTTKGKNRWK